MASSLTHLVDASALLRALSPQVRECLLGRARTRTLSSGETLSIQGEQAGTLKIVVRGWVKVYRVSENGHEAVLSTLGRGESFDEVPAMTGGVAANGAEVISDCEVLMLDLSDICSCKNARAELATAVMTAAQGHLDNMTSQIESLKVKTATRRLGEYLLDLTEQNGGGGSVALPFGKVVLAGLLGIKPESLSRAFARLKPVGVQSELRAVRIKDPVALREWTERQAAG
ncbi:Crp/Fnr family transcriptional regulator [Shimia sediminis]|uniref:Crp/Fnr family transcriptional regulator n=1 Tax=Shimia sediminis TaxID=2497945 RepID=UPI000F8CDCDB|nr:Crp/Fnr family transcriptional regulator [Shimia sediminis]